MTYSQVPRLPPAPSPFASPDEWEAWHRERRRLLPPSHADRDLVTSYALGLLPRVCAHLGCGEPVGMPPRPRWWHGLVLSDAVAALHGTRLPALPVMIAHRLVPGSDDLLLIDRAIGEWSVPNLCRFGDDLVSLAAWRWSLSNTEAAWKLAELCGIGRPVW